MLSNELPAELLELANNARWANYMKVVFPTMMSHVPGGTNYDLTAPMEVRAAQFVWEVRTCMTYGALLHINLNGAPIDSPKNIGVLEQANELCYSVNLRKVRNKWKKTMSALGWAHNDELWRRADGRDHELWKDHWPQFQAMVGNALNTKQEAQGIFTPPSTTNVK